MLYSRNLLLGRGLFNTQNFSCVSQPPSTSDVLKQSAGQSFARLCSSCFASNGLQALA